jgi:hypothetical protein
MYPLTDQQIDFILRDIKARGVEMEDLQLNLLDHLCCIIEQELEPGGDFESFYKKTIPRFFKKELKEIEEETRYLLTFKHYYAMKKTMIITGTASVAAFITGSLFKVMHWPGAGILLVLGMGITSLFFLPLLFILKTRDKSSPREKLIIGIGSLIGILLCLATLFTVQHWPGGSNGVLWLSAIGLAVFVLIPVYFFTGIRNPDSRLNTIVTSIVLLGASGLLFSMINLRPSLRTIEVKMMNYLQTEDILKKGLAHSTLSPEAENINVLCEKAKQLILQDDTPNGIIPADYEKQNVLVEEHNLGLGFYDPSPGLQVVNELKAAIDKYNTHSESKIPLEFSLLNIPAAKLGAYSNYAVLNAISQVQMYLALK